MRELNGMGVLITGASSGIGRGLAVELARRGARLAVAARREDKLRVLVSELGGGHRAIVADVGKADDCARMVDDAFAHLGRLDTLVCNAGYGVNRPAAETAWDDVRRMFEVNVLGSLEPARLAVPRMKAQPLRDGWRGQLMFVSSAAARRGLPRGGVYSATKAAQLSLVEALRVELVDDRIAATSVHPIGTDTEFFDAAGFEPRDKLGPRQTVGVVVRAMVRAIERPRAEVWTHAPTRLALALNALLPSFGDRVMKRYGRTGPREPRL